MAWGQLYTNITAIYKNWLPNFEDDKSSFRSASEITGCSKFRVNWCSSGISTKLSMIQISQLHSVLGISWTSSLWILGNNLRVYLEDINNANLKDDRPYESMYVLQLEFETSKSKKKIEICFYIFNFFSKFASRVFSTPVPRPQVLPPSLKKSFFYSTL